MAGLACQLQRLLQQRTHALDLAFQLRGRMHGVLAQVLQQHDEVIAAVAGQRGLGPQGLRQALGNHAQQHIAKLQPQAVVEGLEVVHVQQHDGAAAPAPAAGGQRLLQPVHQQAAVGQAGERVVEGQAADFLFGGLALALVLQDQQAAFVQQHAAYRYGTRAAIAAHELVFLAVEGATAVGLAAVQALCHARPRLRGLEAALHAQAAGFIGTHVAPPAITIHAGRGTVARQAHEFLVPIGEAAVVLKHGQAQRQALDDHAQMARSIALHLLQVAPRADVLHQRHQPPGRAMAQRGDMQLHPDQGAVAAPQLPLDLQGPALARRQFLQQHPVALQGFGRQQGQQGPLAQLLRLMAGNVAVPAVHMQDVAAGRIDLHHAHGSLLEQGLKAGIALAHAAGGGAQLGPAGRMAPPPGCRQRRQQGRHEHAQREKNQGLDTLGPGQGRPHGNEVQPPQPVLGLQRLLQHHLAGVAHAGRLLPALRPGRAQVQRQRRYAGRRQGRGRACVMHGQRKPAQKAAFMQVLHQVVHAHADVGSPQKQRLRGLPVRGLVVHKRKDSARTSTAVACSPGCFSANGAETTAAALSRLRTMLAMRLGRSCMSRPAMDSLPSSGQR
ncbi:hypothetical protein GY15_05765 [Delftia sp. 670]|nr:hypothetical protein GY15_05765 [Delftia sp. 670]